jgi:two-component system cell cycle response regulator CtrA
LLGDTPDLTGCDMLKSLRAAKIKSPMVIMSGDKSVDRIAHALNLGADDYLTKPFHKDELVARIHAIVRRSKGHPVSIITTGNLSVNITAKTVTVDGQRVHLTAKEYGILELLSLRKGMTISKEMLLNHLYGGMDEPEIKIIDVFICKIRKKLNDATEGRECFIETVWGRGHVLRDEAVASVPSPSLAPEMREMLDMTEQRGVDYVSKSTFMEKRNEDIKAGRVKAPSIVPAAGQK